MNPPNDWFVASAITLIEFAATWWLQAAVLLATAFVVSKLLRNRGPAVHSVIFRVTLLAVLLSPLITKALTFYGAQHLSLDLRSMLLDDSENQSTSEPTPQSPSLVAAPTISPASFDDLFNERQPAPDLMSATSSPVVPSNDLAAHATEQTLAPKLEQASVLPIPAIAENKQLSNQFSLVASTVLIALWIVGSVVFALRIVRDLYNSKLLLRSSVISDDLAHKICGQVAGKLNLKTPAIHVSPFLNSPCLLGHWKPTVLLPEETEPSTYPQVFLHELAHLRRGDWLWNLIGRAAVALLWAQPLIWWLQHRSLTVSEEICDDYVIQHGCNRENYLRQLVEIAERSLPLAAATGVSMVGFRTKLGSRAVRILDTTRSLSTRAGKTFACFMMMAMLAVTIAVALIEVGKPMTALAAEPKMAAQADSPPASGEILPAGALRTFTGRVLGLDGQPKADVHVYAENDLGNINKGTFQSKTLASTQTKPDGSYELTFKPEDGQNYIIAETSGFGPGVLSFENDIYQRILKGENQFDLQLAKQKSIHGKIVDTEGNAIAGVRVRVVDLAYPKSESAIVEWIANEKPEVFTSSKDNGFGMLNDTRVTNTSFPVSTALYGVSSIVPKDVRTAADGSFVLPNVAENCRFTLYLTGPTIASQIATVISRDMRNVQAFNWLARETNYTHYGAAPTIVASPTQPIVGQITDADSKQPIPNVRVDLNGFIGRGNLFGSDSSSNVTDKDGRFAIIGAPIGKKQQYIEITPSNELPYFAAHYELPASSSGAEPLQFNVQLPRSKWITGTIKDQAGKPIIAKVHYYPFRNNPYAEKFKNFDPAIAGHVPDDRIVTDENGHFRIQAIPGKGILAAEVSSYEEQSNYELNCSEELLKSVGGIEMPYLFNSWSALSFDALAAIDLDDSANDITQDLTFIKGATRLVKVRDNHGEPMSKLMVLGATSPPNFQYEVRLDNSTLTIKSLRSSDKRQVVILSPDGTIGKAFVVDGAQTSDIDVTLEPCSRVTGRVVDEDGNPIHDLTVQTTVHTEHEHDNWAREIRPVVTDADGKFTTYLPIGGRYSVASYRGPAGPNFTAEVQPAAGASYDLGDIKHGVDLKQADTKKLESVADANSSTHPVSTYANQPTDQSIAYTGIVNDAQGKPVAGAFVSLIAIKKDDGAYTNSEAIAETKTDASGKYTLHARDTLLKTYGNAHIVIRSETSAIVALAIAKAPATTTLHEQQVLKIRLIDLEGNPLPNVDLEVGSITPAHQRVVSFYPMIGQPKAWLPRLKSDVEGQVQIPNLAADCGTNLHVHGNEHVAPQSIAINIGPQEQPAVDRNVLPDQIASFALAPAKIFEGDVFLGDENTPASNTKIEILAAQHEHGSQSHIEYMTDDKGHFKANPKPGTIYGIFAYPPENSPFQIAALDGLRWSAGSESKQIKIVLQRGILARGRILDADSGQPIANASVQYEPSPANSNLSKSILTGWLGIKRTNLSGEFSIAVPPGAGCLLVHANDRRYILERKSQRELWNTRGPGALTHANAFAKLNPQAAQELEPLDIQLHQGKTVKLVASAPNGEPIANALAISRLKILARFEGRWRAQDPDQVHDGIVEFEGLASNQTYPIHLLDLKQNLGATVNLTSDQPEVKVTLQPCGSAKVRFIDANGAPLADHHIRLSIVSIPIATTTGNDSPDAKLPEVDFVLNFDRTERPEGKSKDDGIAIASALIPGATYRYESYGKSQDFVAKSGETYDLGDVKIGARIELTATKTQTPDASPSSVISYTGVVNDTQGKPIAGAFISLIATKTDGDSYLNTEPIVETKTDTNGHYSLQLKDVSPKNYANPSLVIRSEKSAILALPIQLDTAHDAGAITLKDQQPIAARLIDLEGNPVPDAELIVNSITAPDGPGVGFWDLRGNPTAWFPKLKSDANGRVQIPNLAAGQGLYVSVVASDKVAPQMVAINTGMPTERAATDRTYRPTAVNAAPGEFATVPLSPAKVFEGTVVLGEDGPPAANAKITISAAQQELGSMMSASAKTDANGHFKLIPYPGVQFAINAHPPEGSPFQIARLNDLRWSAGEQAKQIKITLPRGVFASGRVIDADSQQPVSNASVLYQPSSTNTNSTDSVVTGWQGMKKTNEQGEFSIPVLPGEGWLFIQANHRSYILQTKQSRELESGKKGGRYLYSHAFTKINPDATNQPAPLTIELHKGKSATIVATAPDGSPIKQALALSRLKVFATSAGVWRAQHPDEIRNGTVTFEGLAPGQQTPIYLLDPTQKLGATVNLSADAAQTNVTLQPTGSLRARFLDSENKPLSGRELSPMIVVTPGLAMFEMSDTNRDVVLADEDFEVNYDRTDYPSRTSGADGVAVLPTLIPGATYRYYIERQRREFVAKSGETYDLGDIVVQEPGAK